MGGGEEMNLGSDSLWHERCATPDLSRGHDGGSPLIWR